MRISRSVLLAAAAFIGLSSNAAQAAITYEFDLPVDQGSVKGTITTDGTIGQLFANNITSWSLDIVGNGATNLLTQLDSVISIGGSKLTATAQHIFFDFTHNDGAPSYFLVQRNLNSGTDYACASNATYPNTPCFEGTSAVPVKFSDASSTFGHPTANTIIASVASVPEVTTWAMMIAGLTVVGMAMRRQRVAVSFA